MLTAATYQLGLPLDSDIPLLDSLLCALSAADISSTSDFRFTFVTNDEVDMEAVDEFASGELAKFHKLINHVAEDLIDEDCDGRVKPVKLRKRALPSHNVCGRLVYQRLEDFEDERSSRKSGPAQPLRLVGAATSDGAKTAAEKLRVSALRSQAKLDERLLRGQSEDLGGHLDVNGATLHTRAEAQKEKAVESGYLVLKEVGSISPRFSQVFNESGDKVSDLGIIGAFNDIVLAGLEPQVVQNYCTESFRFLQWVASIGLDIKSLNDLRVAGYIKNTTGRGKTVPGRVRHALVWLQRLVDCDFGVEKVEMQKMVRTTSTGPAPSKEPVAAIMIPIEYVRKLEWGCWKARTGVLRIFCGLGCLLTFGIKRWSDAQRMQSMTLAEDALVVKSWKSKKKKTAITWGALRSGFEKADWAKGFQDALADFGLPCKDYLIHAPRTDMMGFTKSPARWGDAERGIHAALIEVGVPVDEAITFTLHSFKHLLVTAGRQLQVPEPAIDVMAGWAVKSASGMAEVYDSVSATSELVYKDFIHKNIQKGWSLSAEGRIPLQPVVPFLSCSNARPVSEETPKAAVTKPPSTQKGADLQLRRMADSPLGDSVIQCQNTTLGIVHLQIRGAFQFKDPRTCCGRQYGSPTNPAKNMKFSDSSQEWTGENSLFHFCERCYGDCYPVDRCISSPKKGKQTKDKPKTFLTDSSASSSSSDSSESESRGQYLLPALCGPYPGNPRAHFSPGCCCASPMEKVVFWYIVWIAILSRVQQIS